LPGELLAFFGLAAVAVVASIAVIGQRNAMYSVLLLIASFAALAGLYVLLDAPFVAVIQIIIYAGAIMVLFLFVVMLLNAPIEETPPEDRLVPSVEGPRRLGAVLAAALVIELVWALSRVRGVGLELSSAELRTGDAALGSVQQLGRVLFQDYAFAFEVTSILIIVAMIGAVVLAKREL
jgi:NADH-quinone oxidoreductase subunit J